MTRLEILDYQLKKNLTDDDYAKVDDADKKFALEKAKTIVDDYVNYTSGSELNYIICDMALDMIQDDLISGINVKPIPVPTNVASLKEGDTIITFHHDSSSSDSSSSNNSATVNHDSYYLDTYRDRLNRHRRMRR